MCQTLHFILSSTIEECLRRASLTRISGEVLVDIDQNTRVIGVVRSRDLHSVRPARATPHDIQLVAGRVEPMHEVSVCRMRLREI